MMGEPIWRNKAWVGLFADPFVEGTQLEGGKLKESVLVLSYVLRRLCSDRQLLRRRLPFVDADRLLAVKAALDQCLEMLSATEEVEEVDSFAELLADWQQRVEALEPGGVLLAPGGWKGLTAEGSVMFVLERGEGVEESMYSVVCCNAGQGCWDYHPASAHDPPKMKYKTCIKIGEIPRERVTQPPVWALLFSLWLKQSEYHRVEVVYDVVLPWLAGGLLTEALVRSAGDEATNEWRSPQRGGTSPFRCVWEALRYLCKRQCGMTRAQLKALTLEIRREMLDRAREDVEVLLDPKREHEVIAPEAPPDNDGRPLYDILHGNLVKKGGQPFLGNLRGRCLGIYFSGGWCPPCKQFTPVLSQTSKLLRSGGAGVIGAATHSTENPKGFEVVFVSADKDQGGFDQYFGSMPDHWLAVHFSAGQVRRELQQLYGVSGIPALIIIGEDGEILNRNGRAAVAADPGAERFPWRAGDQPGQLPDLERLLLKYGCDLTSLAAVKENEAGRLDCAGLQAVEDGVAAINSLTEQLPTDEETGSTAAVGCHCCPPGEAGTIAVSSVVPPKVDAQMQAPLLPLCNVELLKGEGMEKYAGAAMEASTPPLANMLDIPDSVGSFADAVRAIEMLQNVVELLMARCNDSSTSARVVLQQQCLLLIGDTFGRVLPTPAPLDASKEKRDSCIWTRESDAPTKAAQIKCLGLVHKLMKTYGTLWQIVEAPTRAFDSERAIVSSTMFSIFDALMRVSATDENLLLTDMLIEEGGYSCCSNVCQDSRPLEAAFKTTEITTPHLNHARCGAIDYITSTERCCSHILFDLKQPDQIEVLKYSGTAIFLRKLLERCGIELIPRDNPQPPPEMEALMEYLCSDATRLVEHESGKLFLMLRDVVFMFKVLATAETREDELLRKRHDLREYQRWHLSFEQRNRSWGNQAVHTWPLRWEATNFRGADLDIADMTCMGFGGRNLLYGEGPVVQSPADLSKKLGIRCPTEDDVLRCCLPSSARVPSKQTASTGAH
eukprot:COSAG02_NODE_2468_length_8763_cov_3.000923_1_plen_1006_part_00